MLSYNRILSFVVGARGLGKTYGMKKYVINRFLKNGEQFIYLKRYKTDLKGTKQFFDSVSKEFPDTKFSVKGEELRINGQMAGWIMPLSAWQSVKSREFPNVTTIIYDEFLLEKHSKQRYMNDEPVALLNFMDTVIRNRENARCVCLANAVSIANPYFIYFDLVPDRGKRYNPYPNIVVEIADSYDFSSARSETKFGKLIQGTEYGDFSLGNEFINDSNTFIEKRSSDSIFHFMILYRGMKMGVWADSKRGEMYISNDYDPSSRFKYVILSDDIAEDTTLISNWRKNYHFYKMVNAFLSGALRFDNQVLRTTGYDIFRRIKIY